MAHIDSNEKKLSLSNHLLRKYSDLINEKEKKTVREVKALVNPDDLTIQSIVEKFKPENYSYEKDFSSVARKLFDFCQTELTYSKLDVPLSYWLSPTELMSLRTGDDEDLSVFFCSMLNAIGNKAFVIISELIDSSSHSFVFTNYNGKVFIFDLSQKHSFEEFSGNEVDVLRKYSFNGNKIKGFLYKFNSDEYKEFI